MNLIEKLKENQFVVICIVCAIVIPITAGVITWFYEKQKELIHLKHEVDDAKNQAKIVALEAIVRNFNNETLKKVFNKSKKIFVGQEDDGSPPVIVDKIDQKIEITDDTNYGVEDEIKYSHVIFVDGADGISLRDKVLEKKELDDLQSGKSKGDPTYILTLMNGHKVQILPPPSGKWYKVRTRINGEIKEGFICGYYKKKPTVKKITTLLKWKGKWYTAWTNPMSYETTNKKLIEFFNNEISTFYGKYSYTAKQGYKVEGKIQNINFFGDILKGDWVETGPDDEVICGGTLEFLMFSDGNSFIGRFKRNRDCEPNPKFRIWKGKRGI